MHDVHLDQAAGLRRLGRARPVKVIAVTGGKGGVGKTVVAVNLGARSGAARPQHDAARRGLRAWQTSTCCSAYEARMNLEHVISGQCALEDVILTASSGLRVVPASSGSVDMATLERAQHAGLIQRLQRAARAPRSPAVDTAAGLSDGVMTFSETAQHVVVVVCDEPASITDAYGLIKVLARRQPELPHRGRRQHGRRGRRTAARCTTSSRESAIASSVSHRITSVASRTTNTCAARFGGKRRSSRRIPAVASARAFRASPARPTAGSAERSAARRPRVLHGAAACARRSSRRGRAQ